MAKVWENDCVGCPQGCINCGRKRVAYYYCDICDDCFDIDELYVWEDGKGKQMLCKDCLCEKFDTVEFNECDDGGFGYYEEF